MLALTLSGCTGKAEKPAMVVNDVAVPQGVLNYYINYGKDYLASYGIDINDPETGAQYMSLIEEQGVDIVTEIAVVRALAKEAGLSVAPEQIAENLQTEKKLLHRRRRLAGMVDNLPADRGRCGVDFGISAAGRRTF